MVDNKGKVQGKHTIDEIKQFKKEYKLYKISFQIASEGHILHRDGKANWCDQDTWARYCARRCGTWTMWGSNCFDGSGNYWENFRMLVSCDWIFLKNFVAKLFSRKLPLLSNGMCLKATPKPKIFSFIHESQGQLRARQVLSRMCRLNEAVGDGTGKSRIILGAHFRLTYLLRGRSYLLL